MSCCYENIDSCEVGFEKLFESLTPDPDQKFYEYLEEVLVDITDELYSKIDTRLKRTDSVVNTMQTVLTTKLIPTINDINDKMNDIELSINNLNTKIDSIESDTRILDKIDSVSTTLQGRMDTQYNNIIDTINNMKCDNSDLIDKLDQLAADFKNYFDNLEINVKCSCSNDPEEEDPKPIPDPDWDPEADPDDDMGVDDPVEPEEDPEIIHSSECSNSEYIATAGSVSETGNIAKHPNYIRLWSNAQIILTPTKEITSGTALYILAYNDQDTTYDWRLYLGKKNNDYAQLLEEKQLDPHSYKIVRVELNDDNIYTDGTVHLVGAGASYAASNVVKTVIVKNDNGKCPFEIPAEENGGFTE